MVEASNIISPGISHKMDFIGEDRLEKKLGVSFHNPTEILDIIFREILCNALDKPDATEIIVSLTPVGDGKKILLVVKDNGKMKFYEKDIKLLFGFRQSGQQQTRIEKSKSWVSW